MGARQLNERFIIVVPLTGGSHKVSKALFAICVLTILFNILLFAVILSKKELRQQVQMFSYLRE